MGLIPRVNFFEIETVLSGKMYLEDIPGVDSIWNLFIRTMPDWRFDSKPPVSGLAVIGSSDLVLEGKIIHIDFVKYNISREHQFSMLEVKPMQGLIHAVRCGSETSRIIYSDREHFLFQWKPTTANMASDRGMGWSCYYEALLAIRYTGF